MEAALVDEIAAAAVALVPPAPGARVLDVEAGLGALTLRLARAAGVHVDAVDASKAIVAALKARLAVAKLTNVEARVGDAAALPFTERSFDAAFCSGALAGAVAAAAMDELRRVLKPGAPAVVAAADAHERDALVEDMALAGFDDVDVHAVGNSGAWLIRGIA